MQCNAMQCNTIALLTLHEGFSELIYNWRRKRKKRINLQYKVPKRIIQKASYEINVAKENESNTNVRNRRIL